jgi:hypothetical protein
MTMTIGIAVTVVLGFGAVVVWALWRLFRSVSRYDDWDYPPVKGKREHWK